MATRHLLFTVLKLTQFRFFFFSLSPLTIQLKYSLVLFLFLFYLNLMVFRSCLPFIMFSLSICLVCVFGLIKISHSLRSAFVSALVLLVLSPSQWMQKGTLHCSRSGFARIGLYTCTYYTRSAMKKESTTKGLLLFPYCLSAFCHLSPPTIMSLCLSVFLYLSLSPVFSFWLSVCLSVASPLGIICLHCGWHFIQIQTSKEFPFALPFSPSLSFRTSEKVLGESLDLKTDFPKLFNLKAFARCKCYEYPRPCNLTRTIHGGFSAEQKKTEQDRDTSQWGPAVCLRI